MGASNSKRVFFADPVLIPRIGQELGTAFRADGYEVLCEDLFGGGVDLSLRKGGMFKAVLGLKTALKVQITASEGHILVEASVGIFGQQAIPTAISMLIFWPVLITQIWGLVNQAKLDDLVMQRVQEAIARHENRNRLDMPTRRSFCPACGQQITVATKFCPECGTKM